MKVDTYMNDYTDEISELVEEAHAIFSATMVSEVMDMRDRQSQEDFLNKIYNNPGTEAILSSFGLQVIPKITVISAFHNGF